MLKQLSTFQFYSALIGLAILMAGVLPTAAQENAAVNGKLGNTTPSETELKPLKIAAPLTAETDTNTIDRVEQAATAEEIKPGDWAYQSLGSLIAKYDCGNLPDRALSREEFASNLNTCLQSVEELIALDRKRKRPVKRKRPARTRTVTPPSVAPEPVQPEPAPSEPPVAPPPPENTVSQQDLEELKQLTQAFRTELQGLDARLQAIEAQTAALKDKSFSNTTKLAGEAIFAITGLAGGPDTATRNTIFSDRVRLNFRTSFSGKDLLWTRLQSINSNSFSSNPPGTTGVANSFSKTNMTRLGFEGNGDNSSILQKLQYRFPFTPQTTVFIEPTGAEFNDNVYNFNPEHQSSALGSITRFGRFNPVYRLSGTGAGITIDHKFDSSLGLVLGYAVPQGGNPAVDTASNPAPNNGLFNGSNVFFSQLALKPSEDVNLGLIYARSYHTAGTGVTSNGGSSFANNPFNGAPTSANHYSLLASVNLSKDLILSGWGGLTQANREGAAGSADIWNYAATLAAKDFGGKGHTLGFVVGVPPKVTSNSGATAARVNTGTSLHLETFYKYKVNDNLYITPGILLLTNPEHNSANPTEYLGTIRTTFTF